MENTGGSGTLDAPYCMQVQITNASDNDWEGVIHLELCFGKGGNPRFFLPGFMYGTNRGEAPLRVENEFPRLRRGEKNRPASPWWMVRSDRLSHPAAFVYLGEEKQQGGMMYGLCASPYFILENGRKVLWKPGHRGGFFQYTGFSCSIEEGRIGYTLGYENAPWLYVQSHTVRERAPLGENCFVLNAGETVAFEVMAYEYEAEDERTIYSAVASVYDRFHEAPRSIGSIRETVSDLAHAVSEDAWIEEDKSYTGFVFLEPDGSFRYNKIYSLSWTNGLASAVPVLMAALRLDDESMRQQALTCIDMIVEHSMNRKSGLPYGAYDENGIWSNHGWWFDGMHTPGHSSYLTGQAVYYVLKAYEYEKTLRGTLHPKWLVYSEAILERLEQTKNTEEEYPYILSEKTGAGLEYDSFGSCWCLAAAAYDCLLTGNGRYLEGMKRSEAHYYEAYVAHAECYGGPADTDKAMDSEGILAYIRAAACLHRITGEEQYLDHLRDAISYEVTFKFCYNSPVKVPPLNRIGWSSCGGSITSVANPHIHPMSASVIDEMTYYLTCRQDPYIESRRRDTILWCCQTYNRYDGEYDYGKKGWMSERFCHCQGLLTETYPDGSPASTWFALMPWAAGSILEGLCGTVDIVHA
jgi:hypothetical protein